jgi:hypothetical protein
LLKQTSVLVAQHSNLCELSLRFAQVRVGVPALSIFTLCFSTRHFSWRANLRKSNDASALNMQSGDEIEEEFGLKLLKALAEASPEPTGKFLLPVLPVIFLVHASVRS